MTPFGVLVLIRSRDHEALADRLGQSPPATTAACACASWMRSTACLTSKFSVADCCTSEVSVESLKVDHHAAVCAPSEVTCAPPSVLLPTAVADHCAGTFGFGLTKFGPTAQPASVQPSEARTRARRVLLESAMSFLHCSRCLNIQEAAASVTVAITASGQRSGMRTPAPAPSRYTRCAMSMA